MRFHPTQPCATSVTTSRTSITSTEWAQRPKEPFVSSLTSTLSLNTVRRLSNAAKANIAGLVLTAAGMLLQINGGSALYPSLTGPIVLVITALVVAFVPGRWPAYAGLVVPVVLGIGAIVAAIMTGDFIEQLINLGNAGVFLGSVLHVVGIVAAVAGGVGMIQRRRAAGDSGR